MVVPIKGNIHCTGISAARQRNRRRAKKEIKVGEGLGLPELFLNSTSELYYRLSGQAERSVQQGDQRGTGLAAGPRGRGGARGGQPGALENQAGGLGDHGGRQEGQNETDEVRGKIASSKVRCTSRRTRTRPLTFLSDITVKLHAK